MHINKDFFMGLGLSFFCVSIAHAEHLCPKCHADLDEAYAILQARKGKMVCTCGRIFKLEGENVYCATCLRLQQLYPDVWTQCQKCNYYYYTPKLYIEPQAPLLERHATTPKMRKPTLESFQIEEDCFDFNPKETSYSPKAAKKFDGKNKDRMRAASHSNFYTWYKNNVKDSRRTAHRVKTDVDPRDPNSIKCPQCGKWHQEKGVFCAECSNAHVSWASESEDELPPLKLALSADPLEINTETE